MKLLSLSIFCSLLLGSCISAKDVDHSFFVAGHTYGNPKEKVNVKGLYPLFVEKIPFINRQIGMDNGFLLGDVVRTPRYWREAASDISKFTMPIHMVRGNHDGNLETFEEMFDNSYKKFLYKNNLYIILDTNLDKWNISGDQLTFLMNALRIDGNNVDNIFIMMHHIIWYSEEKLRAPKPNSYENRAKKLNFWTRIEPLLRNQQKPVYVFAGDIGAFAFNSNKYLTNSPEYFYHNYDNITFIGTGMGGGVRDNFIIADVHKDQSVTFRLINLNGKDIHALGNLEDYDINGLN